MSRSPLRTLKLQFILKILFLLVVLAIGLVRPGGQPLIWAAPEQNPNLQTLPDRPPDDEPTPEPPGSPPRTDQDDNGDKDNDGNKKKADNALPGQPSGIEAGAADNTGPEAQSEEIVKTQTDQPSAQEVNTEQGKVQAAQTSVMKDSESQLSSTLTDSSVAQSAATQADSNQVTDSANSSAAPGVFLVQGGSLLWLYALGLGIILIVGGVVLGKHA